MTFSTSMRISLIAEVYGKRDVLEAHEAAVKKAFSHIETELARMRKTMDRKTETVKTGNVTVAMFRHNTSRDLDPQTHTVIMNVTKLEDE